MQIFDFKYSLLPVLGTEILCHSVFMNQPCNSCMHATHTWH